MSKPRESCDGCDTDDYDIHTCGKTVRHREMSTEKDEGLEALASDMIRSAVLRAEQGRAALELLREFVAEIEDNLTDGEINEFLPSYVVPTYREAKALLEGEK